MKEASHLRYADEVYQIQGAIFEVYKTLEHKKTTVKDILHRDDAMDIINKCIKQYNDFFQK